MRYVHLTFLVKILFDTFFKYLVNNVKYAYFIHFHFARRRLKNVKENFHADVFLS